MLLTCYALPLTFHLRAVLNVPGGAACSHADCGLRQEVDVLTAVIVLLLLFSVRFS